MGRNVRFIEHKYNIIFNSLNGTKDYSNQIHYHWLNRGNVRDITRDIRIISSMIPDLDHYSLHP